MLPEELGLAETSRAPLGEVVMVGDDIIVSRGVWYVLKGTSIYAQRCLSSCDINSS
jgi:hypothetical protein